MVSFLADWPTVPTSLTMESSLNFSSTAHLALIAMEDIINFGTSILVKLTLQAGVLAKGDFTLWIRTL